MMDTSVLTSVCRNLCSQKYPNLYDATRYDHLFCEAETTAMKAIVDSKFPLGTIEVFGARAQFTLDVCEKVLASTSVWELTGYDQVVMLGAGLDPLAKHLSYTKRDPMVFEVDRPIIQANKLAKIKTIEDSQKIISWTDRVEYVPCEFGVDDVFVELQKANFDLGIRTIFVWTGVTYYLDQHVIASMLKQIADTMRNDFVIILDYAIETGAPTTPAEKELAKMGEPIKTKFKSLAPILYGLGRPDDLHNLQEVSIQTYLLRNNMYVYEGDARHLMFAVIASDPNLKIQL